MTAEGWEDEAENWIAWTRAPGHDAYPLYRDAFLALLPAPGTATLEVGCGEGRVARDLAARGHQVTGIDAASSLIDAARLAHPEGRYVLGDATSLPFPDRSFDLVVAYNSLMDIAAMETAVSEAARVLTPDGRLCICVTHPTADAGTFTARCADAPFTITGSYLEDRIPPYAGKPVQRDGLTMTFHSLRYSLEEYGRALENAGLVIEALREPAMPADAVDRDPSRQRWRRIPNFLMLRAARHAAIQPPSDSRNATTTSNDATVTEMTNTAPVTIKGVCLDATRRVLLCHNDRAEWELPGGRPELHETFDGCLVREIREETGLSATVVELVAAYPYEVIPGRWVNVIVFRCDIEDHCEPLAGDEHDRIAFVDPGRLGELTLADGYRHAIDACLERT